MADEVLPPESPRPWPPGDGGDDLDLGEDLNLGEGLAGLPAGRFLEEWLAEDEPGLAMHLPSSGVPLLTYLSQDLAAGWRG